MAGYKTWAADDVLTAADMNSFLMQQTVIRFASASARDSAILSPAEGMVVYLIDTNKFQQYNGSAWVGFNSEYVNNIKIWTGAGTPTPDASASVNLWFN